MYHDYVFWMGDLNFRLEQDTFTFQQIELKVSKNEHRDLLIEDQLTKVRETGAAFSELSENLPTFPPSFKYKVGTSVFDPKRRPAWTDRVLFKVNKANFDTLDLNLEQLSYESHPAFLDSDHKPVSAGFKMQVMTPDLADKLLIPCFKPVVKFHTGKRRDLFIFTLSKIFRKKWKNISSTVVQNNIKLNNITKILSV